MAHNRKHQSAAVRFGPALKVLLLCLFVGGSGVGYVWQKNQLLRLSSQLKNVEKDLEKRRGENQLLNRYVAERLLPEALEAKVHEFKLGLVPTSATNILFVTDRPIEPSTAGNELTESKRSTVPSGLASR